MAKSPPKTPTAAEERAEVRKPKHGRGLLRVGNPGNQGGAGRPPSVIREQLRGSFAQRIPMLEEIADGVPYQRIDVPLHRVLEYAECPRCKGALKVRPGVEPVLITIEGRGSASVNDRIKAVDAMAKYGLGTTKELTAEDVKERLAATIATIRRRCTAKAAESILAEMREQWR